MRYSGIPTRMKERTGEKSFQASKIEQQVFSKGLQRLWTLYVKFPSKKISSGVQLLE